MVLLVKISIVILVLLAFYKFLLERESFFSLNRIYLFVGLLLAFTLPFIPLPQLIDHQGVVTSVLEQTTAQTLKPAHQETISFDFREMEPGKPTVSEDGDVTTAILPVKKSILFWAGLVYFFGVLVLFIHFISQLISIFWKTLKAKDLIKDGEVTIINVTDNNGPRSFFNYIFINPEEYDPNTYEQILEHEKIHVRHRHSLDLLLTEIAIIILWFNPFIWLFRKEIEKNIEYQTDALLLKSSAIEAENYQMNLLQIATEHKPLTLVSNYNQSLIKKRIVMMNKKKSNKHSIWKYAFIAPTLLVTLLFLNKPFSAQAQDRVESVYHDDDDDYEDDYDNDLSPLSLAAWQGNYSLVQQLVEKGADVNQLQNGEGTALTLAIRKREYKIAKYLLEKGADPDLGTNADGHPLWLAAQRGDIELVRLLVKKGADVNTKFPGDGSALIQACSRGSLEMVKVLVELKADIDMVVEGDGNPLIMAAKGGYFNIVSYLVGLGADVNSEAQGDETPLINASEQGYLKVVEYLVENGADVHKICTDMRPDGTTRTRTALKMAKRGGHNDVVKYLKSKGAKE